MKTITLLKWKMIVEQEQFSGHLSHGTSIIQILIMQWSDSVSVRGASHAHLVSYFRSMAVKRTIVYRN